LEEDLTLSDRTPLAPDDIVKLLGLCLKCTYFLFQGEYYLQIHGAAMGSPVSPIVCNLYMEYFEQRALAEAKHPPRLWRRYVDDTYAVLKKSHGQEFTDFLNTVDDDIKWTTEGEVVLKGSGEGEEESTERALAFLDTWSVIKEDGSVKTKVFRKETHTDQYLSFNSNHPLEHKRGVVRTLMHRANTVVSDAKDREQEKSHIQEALRMNGYPEWVIQDPKAQPPSTQDESVQDTVGEEAIPDETTEGGAPSTDKVRKKYPVVIPYVKGVSEQMRRVLKGYGLKVYFKPTNTLRQILVRPKDKVLKERVTCPVYQIKCEDCEDSYIGETGRSFKARFQEHRRKSSVNSEVSKHINNDCPDHHIDMDKAKILEVEPKWFERGVREAIHIRMLRPTLNRDAGRYYLPHVWDNTLKAVNRRGGGPGPRTSLRE
jgi:hypothetical protein